jgi:endonuclease V
LIGDSKRVWGAALRSNDNSSDPIYVSIGTKISIETAVKIVTLCCKYRIPEPIR